MGIKPKKKKLAPIPESSPRPTETAFYTTELKIKEDTIIQVKTKTEPRLLSWAERAKKVESKIENTSEKTIHEGLKPSTSELP